MYAPICLFTYNRLVETQQTIDALRNNHLASESELYIFSDGPKKEKDISKVNEVRALIQNTDGFKSVRLFESQKNKGLANSIIDGVSKIIKQNGKIIVLEDDLITSRNFLNFMNQALDFFVNHSEIHSISGFSFDLPTLKSYNKDYYLGLRASSWGWGTWIDRWEDIDWEIKSYSKFKHDYIKQIKFMRGGSDMPRMLKAQMNGRIDSWAIRWCYDQFQKKRLTVFPSRSKIKSIGFGENATHTKKTNRFQSSLDEENKLEFSFKHNLKREPKLEKEFRKKFSIINRFKDKF